MRVSAPALIATHLGAVALGYAVTDKRPVDTEVFNDGYFQTTTTKVLATTIESLREENKLLVFSYKGAAKVKTERTKWWILGGRQELNVPAVVTYYVDLSSLTMADVSHDEPNKPITVRLPRITLGDIAFQPENATTINGGLLSWDDDQVEALRKLNYGAARRAMVAQAQQTDLLNAAKRQAVSNITNYFEIPLRATGQPDTRVIVTFN